MSWDINQVTLIGRLTRDPELRYGQSGTAFCPLSIAVNRKSMREGMQDEVYFFDVTTFGKTAEFCSQYLTKGRQIAVQGYLQQRRWEDQNGQKRSQVTVVAERVQFLTPQTGGQGGGSYQSQNNYPSQSPEPMATPPIADEFNNAFPDDDEIPF